MAKLPYTFTVCPDGAEPEPKKWTATTPRLLSMLRDGPRDLTINQAEHIWPAACKGVTTINNHEDKPKENT
jgi:hypothetical protein